MKKIVVVLISIFLAFSFLTYKTDALSYSVGQVVTNGSNLNLRSDASTSSTVIAPLKNGSYVEIINEKNNFYYVKQASRYGYASKSYIQGKSQNTYVTTANLNIRQSASLTSSIYFTAPKGTNVHVISQSGDFYRVLVNGYDGYASKNYLTKKNSISLNIVSYKQYDSRWKDIEIVPGKTIHRIGCLTTAFAMSESYRLSQTITPAMMVKRLNYTSSGDAYWPTNYITSTSKTNFLEVILNNLKANKPTIVGATGQSMHFVLVTGYNGEGLSAKNFYINDPGSSTRKTLSDFFLTYPNFYKLAYYK